MDEFRSSRIAFCVALGKRQILDDIKGGTVPASVATFSELHDYVDANDYAGLTAWPFDSEEHGWSDDDVTDMNKIQDTLDVWIKAGRPTA